MVLNLFDYLEFFFYYSKSFKTLFNYFGWWDNFTRVFSMFFVLFSSQKWFTHTFLSQIQLVQAFCCKNYLSTLVLLQKRFIHTFVTKTIYALFCHKKNLCILFCRENDLHAFFVTKTIYALRPESFCALKVAIRKVQTFWASASLLMTRDTILHAQIAHIVLCRSLIKEMVITMIMIAHVKDETHRER